MPACVLTSPAVVMVCTPCRNVMSAFGIGVGSQRNCETDDLLLVARRGAPQPGIDLGETAGVLHRRPDPIQPGALVAAARRGERRAGQLFGVKPIGAALRRIAPDRQRAGQRLGLETVAEAGHVARRDIDGAAADRVRRGVDIHGHPPCKAAHISRSRSAVQITGSSIPEASSNARETLNGRQCS